MNDPIKRLKVDLAEEFYQFYVKPASMVDRFNMVWPLFATLGAGFYFVGTRFPHASTDGNIILFYIPYTIGIILLIISASMALFAMFWKSDIELLADPLTLKENLEKIESRQDQESFLDQAKNELAALKFRAASSSFNLMKRRATLLSKASKIGTLSLLALTLSIPRLISSL